MSNVSSAQNDHDRIETWSVDGWRRKTTVQQPIYTDADALQEALAEAAQLPPIVTSREILRLKELLAKAGQGECFLLQAGDCAESFADCHEATIADRLKVLMQMRSVLACGAKKPVVCVGRFAGQYAKPRSAELEERDGVSLPSYRGDLINGAQFAAATRAPDPRRLIRGHECAAMTMNFIRALYQSEFAQADGAALADPDPTIDRVLLHRYRQLLAGAGEFARQRDEAGECGIFSSHEALLLLYEQAMTRYVEKQGGWFNLSTHFPWIGMRTLFAESAHVEYCRGIRNPIALKVGPDIEVDELVAIMRRLNPENEWGRITLIHRMGARRIAERLPAVVRGVAAQGRRATWCCDPMHGNTQVTADGTKTRHFADIVAELERAFDVHRETGTHLAGVHLELTGENVTECLGGAARLDERDLRKAYKSTVDPRLNYAQSLELALFLADHVAPA